MIAKHEKHLSQAHCLTQKHFRHLDHLGKTFVLFRNKILDIRFSIKPTVHKQRWQTTPISFCFHFDGGPQLHIFLIWSSRVLNYIEILDKLRWHWLWHWHCFGYYTLYSVERNPGSNYMYTTVIMQREIQNSKDKPLVINCYCKLQH